MENPTLDAFYALCLQLLSAFMLDIARKCADGVRRGCTILARRKESVNEVRVELDSGLADGVIAAAKRDNPRPREGEAVAFYAVRDEEVDVLLPAVEGVGRNIAVAAVQCLAGRS